CEPFLATVAAVCPAKHGARAQHQLANAERLHDVIIGTELEAHDAVDLLAFGGDHHHRDMGSQGVGFQASTDLGTGDVWKHEIQDHKVELLFPHRAKSHVARGRTHDVKPRLLEIVGKHLREVLLVFDNE